MTEPTFGGKVRHDVTPIEGEPGHYHDRRGNLVVDDATGAQWEERRLAEAAATRVKAPEPEAAPIDQLTDLLGLPDVGERVLGASIYGNGSGASVEIPLSNGETMTLETLRDCASPTMLSAELVACSGAIPKITRADALRAVALLRKVAARTETASANDHAIEWGASFLQAAEVIDVDIADQIERWGAFSLLAERDPWAMARNFGGTPASHSTVIRCVDQTCLVRTGWFQSHVRTLDANVGLQQVAQRMARVGWTKRGRRGRIKATPPDRAGQLAWAFFIVPPGWQDIDDAGYAVTPGVDVHARAKHGPGSRVEAVTRRNPVTGTGVAA